ncbi:hypothetical protein PAJ34TS1_63100 [Paenibacillus azoreducens]|uniref:Uncharacterized protein n=1 Tax=Paenibacillus azoreducens TaxID=116718 RepID=A0A919YEM7_9BACL|nr:hypothetical protein J34TS1_40890 [Paenibacillus azoreducens]
MRSGARPKIFSLYIKNKLSDLKTYLRSVFTLKQGLNKGMLNKEITLTFSGGVK